MQAMYGWRLKVLHKRMKVMGSLGLKKQALSRSPYFLDYGKWKAEKIAMSLPVSVGRMSALGRCSQRTWVDRAAIVQ